MQQHQVNQSTAASHAIMIPRKDMVAAKIKEAIELSKNLEPGTVFKIRNLFDVETWENLHVGDRIKIGIGFSELHAQKKIPHIEYSTLDDKNHHRYKRI